MKNTSAKSAKYAVFVDDGLYETYNTKDEAKNAAANIRANLRSEGRHDSCYVHKLTKDEMEMFG